LSLIAGAVCASPVIVYGVLKAGASFDVRDSPAYLAMYVLLGLAWLRITEVGFAFLGVSTRDDVVERRNAAAAPVIGGALLGVTCCYAGGNIGDGPGWSVVIFSAALATATLGLAWMAYDWLTGVNDVITIDRDPSAGVRLGSFLLAAGLILGRGVAGDWLSAEGTVADFAAVLPVLAGLLVLAALIERLVRPSVTRPRAPLVACGFGIGVVMLALGAGYVMTRGWPQ